MAIKTKYGDFTVGETVTVIKYTSGVAKKEYTGTIKSIIEGAYADLFLTLETSHGEVAFPLKSDYVDVIKKGASSSQTEEGKTTSVSEMSYKRV